MTAIVAELRLTGVTAVGGSVEIVLDIGLPYRCGDDDWACPVSIAPLYGRLSDQHGIDSFQALCLAIGLAKKLLTGFEEEGGKLYHHNGEAFQSHSYGG